MALTLLRHDPFAEFDAMVRRAFPGASEPARPVPDFRPAAEIVRDGDNALVRLELPGMDIDKDITVELDRGALVVRGERRDERAEETDGRVLREIRYGSFRRSFTLPEHVTSADLSASYDAGILTVRVAGVYATAEPQRIAVSTVPLQRDSEDTVDAE